jgi:hypothetical protein
VADRMTAVIQIYTAGCKAELELMVGHAPATF